MKICDFSDEYLTSLLAKDMPAKGHFNINLLNTDTDHSISDFYKILSSNFFAPYILQPGRLTKNFKTLIDIFF